MVDNAPAADEWGDFYSSYSPVFDSKGKVAGIIGVDFNSDWYDMQIREHTLSIVFMTAVSIAVGGIIVLFFTHNIRKRFDTLSKELTILSNDVDALTDEITSRRDYKENISDDQEADKKATDDQDDAIGLLESKLHYMHTELDRYLVFIRNKANTDALTLVGNTTSYTERIKSIEEKIADKTASFCVAVFDINDLKGINDRYGHHCGDLVIKAAADAIGAAFETKNVYRIGGDEFAVVEEEMSLDQMKERVETVYEQIDAYNMSEKEHEAILAVSIGIAEYDPERDQNYRDTFNHADDGMYSNKKEYYKHNHKLKEEYE